MTDALRRIAERQAKQDNCKHVFKSVQGTTAYLQCPKCGKRESND